MQNSINNPQTWSDPSNGVPPSLLPHLHLVSRFQFPVLQQLHKEKAVEYLLQATEIVNKVQPVSWNFLRAQHINDGTTFLTWQPERAMGPRFASDGFVWGDPETIYNFELHGYTIEVYVHRLGYKPGLEQVACHARHRYRIKARSPAIAQPPNWDPALWLVHYCRSDPQAQVPVNRIPINAEMHHVHAERQRIDTQWKLVTKDFMLRDQEHWPRVEMLPGQGQQGFVQPAPPPPNRQSAAPPRKMQKLDHPQQPMGRANAQIPGMPDAYIETEEDTTLGDLLDHLTPRDISSVRYIQHHDWMEEIISSPHATIKIVPVDLGFGLAGTLGALTKDIFDSPSTDELGSISAKAQQSTIPRFRRLKPGQFAEFDKRVKDYVSEGERELQMMKDEHARKLAGLKQSKIYAKAERQLTEIHGKPSLDGEQDPVDLVIADVEKATNLKISPRVDVLCVEKGGLQEKEEPQPNGNDELKEAPTTNGHAQDAMDTTADNSVSDMLNQYGNGGSYSNSPAPNLPLHLSHASSQPGSAAGTPGAMQNISQPQTSTFPDQADLNTSADMGDGMDLIEGMDLDVDMSGMADGAKDGNQESDWVAVDQAAGDQQQPQDTTSAPQAQPSVSTADTTPGTSAAAAAVPPPTSSAEQPGADTTTPGLFDSAEFTNFDSLDDTAGDALADFDGGAGGGAGDDDLGLDLDNSAFGDAVYGTEGNTGESGQNEGA
ncbi:DUF1750-domain-containing protein [Aulographum hederae CBS 113979]|uniref:DUF1750-domain-containing protein n=1 Tax=Aulographum hederae CBS 113979 TaxID=1176131 RepID=A0A6G1GRY1_9PEZI|nr:DUF1750-domain-containing protein [Aulographum hederae CBS 113979]